MEGYSRKDEIRPQLLDLISRERELLVKREEERSHGASEEKKLELRLGPPGEGWTTMKDRTQKNSRERDESQSLLSLRYFSNMTHNTTSNNTSGSKRGFIDTVSGIQTQKFSSGYQGKNQQQQHQTKAQFLQFQSTPQSLPVMAKESSQPCCNKVVDLHDSEKKAFSPASANTGVTTNTSQKRTATTPVVGWPPIRSFRKNIASSSSLKSSPLAQNAVPNKVSIEKPSESCRKGLFVKINMDGIPIGRKVDLKAYDSYEKLSSAVDELFRGLLAAQSDSSASGIQNNQEGEKAITGLLDGSGEYTLVYEDNEGDRVLVGDVPWHMFVSTVKRLRVLKSSELSSLFLGSKQENIPLDAGLK